MFGALSCDITWAPTTFANIVADFLCSSVRPTYNISSSLFCKMYKHWSTCYNSIEERNGMGSKQVYDATITTSKAYLIPLQLVAHIYQESYISVHNGALHVLLLYKNCLSNLQPDNWAVHQTLLHIIQKSLSSIKCIHDLSFLIAFGGLNLQDMQLKLSTAHPILLTKFYLNQSYGIGVC